MTIHHRAPTGPALPAIAVAPGDSFHVVDALDEMNSATPGGLEGYYGSVRLFDRDGLSWPVTAIPEREPSFLDKLLGRRLAIRLELGTPVETPVAVVAEQLCALVDADPDDLYDQFVSHDELVALFRAATSPAELIELVRKLGR